MVVFLMLKPYQELDGVKHVMLCYVMLCYVKHNITTGGTLQQCDSVVGLLCHVKIFVFMSTGQCTLYSNLFSKPCS